MCIFCTIKLLTLLFSTPITINSAVTLCNFCSLLSLFQRSAHFISVPNPGGLQGIAQFPALKCVGVNNVSRVGICCFLYYKELHICNIVVYYLIVFIVK